MHIRYHYIRLTRWAEIRNYTATLQFFKEDVSGDGALTSTTYEGASGGAFAATGFVQCVSDNGVEEFEGGLWSSPGGGFDALNTYTTTFLNRSSVTSMTIAITGNSGANARFAFFTQPLEVEPRGERTMVDWNGADRQAVFVADVATGEIVHVHETIGDASFIARGHDGGEIAQSALRFAGRDGSQRKLEAVSAPRSFRFDPTSQYRLDLAKGAVVPVPRKPQSGAT